MYLWHLMIGETGHGCSYTLHGSAWRLARVRGCKLRVRMTQEGLFFESHDVEHLASSQFLWTHVLSKLSHIVQRAQCEQSPEVPWDDATDLAALCA